MYTSITGNKKNIIPMYNPTDEWFDWSSLGMYGTVPEVALQGMSDFYTWQTGKIQAQKSVWGGKEDIEAQLTDQQRSAYLYFGLYEMSKLFGLSDQTLNSAMRKAQSRIEFQAQGSTYKKKETSRRRTVKRSEGGRMKRNRR